jgi:uncharacterized protein
MNVVSRLMVPLVLAAAAPWATAASFNCSKAVQPMEKLICGDPVLSSLDGRLGTAYQGALARTKDKHAVRQWQRVWLRGPDLSSCKTADCVIPYYQARIVELETAVASPWNGVYQRYYNNKPDYHSAELVLVGQRGGTVQVSGSAVWMGPNAANGGVNVGDIAGPARSVGGKLVFEDSECKVGLARKGGDLVVEDNMLCGGHNVTFAGEYRRKR